MKRVGICGHYGGDKVFLDGQTVKTKILTEELKRQLGNDEVETVDTYGGKRTLLKQLIGVFGLMCHCKNVIILPAQNSVRIYAPLLTMLNILLKRKLHYVVVGGWLPEFVAERKFLSWCLKRFDQIYVETEQMKVTLIRQKFGKVRVLPNCKHLKVLEQKNVRRKFSDPYPLCTFSRVMKEKGIEISIAAVETANEILGIQAFSLDIYGQIDKNYESEFANVMRKCTSCIKYRGAVEFNKSVDTLKDYYALLFPTYYDGEGFAGTLIDAMASGVPIIASDWRYNAELVTEKIGLLCKTNSIESLVERLIWTHKHSMQWIKLRDNCITAASSYLPEVAIQGVLKALD